MLGAELVLSGLAVFQILQYFVLRVSLLLLLLILRISITCRLLCGRVSPIGQCWGKLVIVVVTSKHRLLSDCCTSSSSTLCEQIGISVGLVRRSDTLLDISEVLLVGLVVVQGGLACRLAV